ncbi:2-polyprenyl-6-methoxyphenol hydroxylase [Micromonospora rhizosphaerae]|uniref:2-polyprenyl-6-methoxyphenol hydroxylase n=1 Tax=Micromonospora rhizosphaerae TaxID=568872 RepID=A0A1C6T369_9ACTN|nr:FAD-dependent monooxygenase [Micromonospora rhizosphaerae]SCL36059.1 2-polyprenyl-6-methoxyphenol hydroxylase [Micromonospora rhizosphaerae]
MTAKTVLISGAGVAGPTLAYWLARNGFAPTIVERAAGQRSSGNPVDVRGPAFPIAEKMGLLPRLRTAATATTGLAFIDAQGRRKSRVDLSVNRATEVEVPRADLAAIITDAVTGSAEFIYSDSISALTQDGSGVDVTFERNAPRRFDLVIGTDGQHSMVRRLAWGPETDFVRHRGLYVATLPVERELNPTTDVLLYGMPGRLASVHPVRGHGGIAAFIWRSKPVPGYDYRDTAQHKRTVEQAYAGGSWIVPELIERVRDAGDLYFDAVSQVRLDTWSQGRIGLLGDAASSVSLFGDGSSLAIAGSYTLACRLAEHRNDLGQGLKAYEHEHRKLIAPKQNGFATAATLMVPATRFGVALRDNGARLVTGWQRLKAGAR